MDGCGIVLYEGMDIHCGDGVYCTGCKDKAVGLVDSLRAQLAEAQAENAELRNLVAEYREALLRDCEDEPCPLRNENASLRKRVEELERLGNGWVATQSGLDICVFCRNPKFKGHAPDCVRRKP